MPGICEHARANTERAGGRGGYRGSEAPPYGLVEVPGLEPGLEEPKSHVLPLHHTSVPGRLSCHIISPARMRGCKDNQKNGLESSLDLNNMECLDDIAFLEIIEFLDTETALHSGTNFLGVVLATLE